MSGFPVKQQLCHHHCCLRFSRHSLIACFWRQKGLLVEREDNMGNAPYQNFWPPHNHLCFIRFVYFCLQVPERIHAVTSVHVHVAPQQTANMKPSAHKATKQYACTSSTSSSLALVSSPSTPPRVIPIHSTTAPCTSPAYQARQGSASTSATCCPGPTCTCTCSPGGDVSCWGCSRC